MRRNLSSSFFSSGRRSRGRDKKKTAFPRAVAVPCAALILYGVGRFSGLLVPVSGFIHFLAALVFLSWLFFSLRAKPSPQTKRGSLVFASSLAFLIGLGSCWGGFPSSVTSKVWVSPPAYAHMADESLSDRDGSSLPRLLAGSTVHINLSGVSGIVRARLFGIEKEMLPDEGGMAETSFDVPSFMSAESGHLLLRQGWHKLGYWPVRLVPDLAPQIAFTETPELMVRKTLRLAYHAQDDFGVESIFVRVRPLKAEAGLPSTPVDILLSVPSVLEAKGADYADLTSLPWAGQSVSLRLVAVDGAGHQSVSRATHFLLPSRHFKNPFARALIEEREKLSGDAEPPIRDEAANVMAGIARQQGFYQGDPIVVMSLRAAAVRLVLNATPQSIAVVRDMMWRAAVRLEEGSLGVARADLADAQKDLVSLLRHGAKRDELRPFFLRMAELMDAYFAALSVAKAKQSPVLQEMDWPLSNGKEALTADDLRHLMSSLALFLEQGAQQTALRRLDQLQIIIENLRTTPPDLSPQQYQLVEVTSVLRALVRGQKQLMDEVEALASQKAETGPQKVQKKEALARALSQQKGYLSAIEGASVREEDALHLDLLAGQKAMDEAIKAFENGQLDLVRQKQAEALGLMENILLSLGEQMRQAMAASAF